MSSEKQLAAQPQQPQQAESNIKKQENADAPQQQQAAVKNETVDSNQDQAQKKAPPQKQSEALMEDAFVCLDDDDFDDNRLLESELARHGWKDKPKKPQVGYTGVDSDEGEVQLQNA